MTEQISSAEAETRTIRIVPRGARLIADLIRGKSVAGALVILQLTPRIVSLVIEKMLELAIASAEHNYDLESANLYVSETYVNKGITLERFYPRTRGMTPLVNKKTGHIVVVISEKND